MRPAGRVASPLVATTRLVGAVGAVLLTLAILVGGRMPDAVALLSSFSDKVMHALAYGLLAGFWCVALGGRQRTAAIAIAVCTGILDEWLQRSLPGRQSDGADLVADALGALAGAWLALPVARQLLRVPAWMRAGSVYFALVFGAGFMLGTARVPLLEPVVGEGIAQLLEMPVMAVVILLSAGWLVRRDREGVGRAGWLGAGGMAATGVLVADLAVGVILRGMTAWQVVAGRDPVAGLAYGTAIIVFALAPTVMARLHASRRSGNG
ncbi:MAG: VanZ family protein [Burkholderiales bacterium]|nr:VanZ family protein [Burkholderiales bacterium]